MTLSLPLHIKGLHTADVPLLPVQTFILASKPPSRLLPQLIKADADLWDMVSIRNEQNGAAITNLR